MYIYRWTCKPDITLFLENSRAYLITIAIVCNNIHPDISIMVPHCTWRAGSGITFFHSSYITSFWKSYLHPFMLSFGQQLFSLHYNFSCKLKEIYIGFQKWVQPWLQNLSNLPNAVYTGTVKYIQNLWQCDSCIRFDHLKHHFILKEFQAIWVG